MNDNEVYQHAPLVETVFEIRFPGDPSIECNRDKFYNKIKKDYSKLLVPRCREGVAIALEPYSFEREDGTGAIGLSINKLSLNCKKYEGYQSFKKEILRVFSVFSDIFPEIKVLRRTGLRYINIIPFTREKGIIPLKSYLNVKIDLTPSIPAIFKNLSISFISQTEGGTITTRIEPVIAPDKSEAIILDFDYAKEDNLSMNQLEKYLEESHKHTKYLFEQLITENFRKIMKGEVV